MSWGMGARDHMWVGREMGDFRSSWNWKRLRSIPTLTSYRRNLGQDHAPFPLPSPLVRCDHAPTPTPECPMRSRGDSPSRNPLPGS